MNDREREQRENNARLEKERNEDRRHREKMAIEEKRDRVASMRAEGYSEKQIRQSERKRGCIPLFVIIALIAIWYAFNSYSKANSDPELSETRINDQAAYSETEYDELGTGTPFAEERVDTEVLPDYTRQSSPEIIFESNPVVQPLPPEDGDNPVSNDLNVTDQESNRGL